MKKTFFMAVAVLMTVSCSKENVNEVLDKEQATVPVTVRVSEFSVTQEVMPSSGGTTRAAQNVADYNDVKAIDLAFYDGETLVFKHTQLRSDPTTYTTFGEFSSNLPIGSYKMVAIGRGYYDEDVFVLTSPTAAGYTSERVRETFCAEQDVVVTSNTPLELEVTLNRIVAKLNIVSTDNLSDKVAMMRTTYSKGSKSFSPTSGLATDDNGISITNSPYKTSNDKLSIISFVFLASDEETMDITIEALDENNNVLFTKVVQNVTLKRNAKTTLTGAIFTASPTASSFKLETEWIIGDTVNF